MTRADQLLFFWLLGVTCVVPLILTLIVLFAWRN